MTRPPLRLLLADDEAPARKRLRRLVEAIAGVTVVAEAADGEAAVAAIAAESPEVVVLDIQMPRLDGFGVVATLGDEMPLTIFCTAFDEHALRAFDARAVDYLLKPVQPERLAAAIDRARALLAGSAAARKRGMAAIRELVEAREGFLPRLLVHDERGAHVLPMVRVDQIRAERNQCEVRSEGRRFRLRRPLASLAGRLDPAQFVRVNKSDIVRLDAIREIQPASHGDFRVTMQDGSTLNWSRRYRASAP